MARKKSKKHSRPLLSERMKQTIIAAVLVFVAVLVWFADNGSRAGGFIERFGVILFGGSYRFTVAPILALLGGLILLERRQWNIVRGVGLALYYISVTSLLASWAGTPQGIFDTSTLLAGAVGYIPMIFAHALLLTVALYLSIGFSVGRAVVRVSREIPRIDVMRALGSMSNTLREDIAPKSSSPDGHRDKLRVLEEQIDTLRHEKSTKKPLDDTVEKTASDDIASIEKIQKARPERSRIAIEKTPHTPRSEEVSVDSTSGDTPEPMKIDFSKWEFPEYALLNTVSHPHAMDPSDVEARALEIKRALLQFRIEVEMSEEKVGPTVVQYRLKPADGVKLSRIENLKKDLTLALKAKSLRIQAPIPGIGLVGIEVPNEKRDMVGIREIIEDVKFIKHPSNLALAVGRDINGDAVVSDLAKMPHLLIAGQTGSGKSVVINGFLISLLYKNSPSTLRMILIYPKRVELGIYNNIPHLLAPVITEPDKALNALKWCVAEMLQRYDTLQKVRARNLGEYNAKVDKTERFPHIVIVIDELADFMMSGNKKEVEACITRIAQMARAVGMHLMVATQRPSVDVVTGLIKANIPSRIALSLPSVVDSRTILDQSGAEDLLGNGDMLYYPSGAPYAERVQGVYVSTEEVEAVINHVKRTIDPEMLEHLYDPNILSGGTEASGGSDSDDDSYAEDPKILEEAIRVVRENGKASTSLLQRRMKLGYSRAARVVDILERQGIVGPADGSKAREVY